MNSLEQSISNLYSSSALNFKQDNLSPSDWFEHKRKIQQHVSINMFGDFNWKNSTPYMRKIVDYLSPYSPVTHITLMKGIRTGGTFCLVHNGVPYIMSERPANVMLLSANKELATKTMEGVDSGIDGCDIRHLIGKGSGVQSHSKGDTMEKKFFSGGFQLFNFGGQSEDNLRQVTASIIIADEVDAYKYVSKKGGSITDTMEDRASDAGERKKIIYISSPRLLDSSIIYKKYLDGDQQVYFMPCPICGEMIEFVWNERNENNTRYGVLFDVKNGEVDKKSVRYRCGKCENHFFEHKHKKDMLWNGVWTPQIERMNKTNVSHRISALYAPPSMDGWAEFAVRWQKAWPRGGNKIEASVQTFTNSILGWPFKPEGIKLKSNKLQKNRREYKVGECPFELSKKDGNGEIIMITLSCDLNGYGPTEQSEGDPRIDWELEACSEKGATYSIDAGSVGTFLPKAERVALEKEGKNVAQIEHERAKNKLTYKFDVDNSVWPIFEDIMNRKFGKDSNIPVTITCVDVGHLDTLALEFVRRMKQKRKLCIGVKGANKEQFIDSSKTDKGRIYELSSDSSQYLINVNIIKDNLARYMDANSYVDDNGQLHQDANFMNFPERDPNSKKYTYRNFFAHFEAEEKMEKKIEGGKDKYIWEKKKSGIQNHFWDVSVYNKFARIFMTDFFCSNSFAFKSENFKSEKINASWENACKMVKMASKAKGVPLS